MDFDPQEKADAAPRTRKRWAIALVVSLALGGMLALAWGCSYFTSYGMTLWLRQQSPAPLRMDAQSPRGLGGGWFKSSRGTMVFTSMTLIPIGFEDGIVRAWSPIVTIVRVPYWAPCLFFLACSALSFWRFRALGRVSQEGLCRRCGYDLRATPQRCPECGTVANAGGK